MSRKNAYPRKRAMVAALAGALAGTIPLIAKANCGATGTISSNTGEIGWSSGNCTISANVTLSNFITQTAFLATGASLGTLTNNGTIAGFTYGVLNAGTISVLTNNSVGRIISQNSTAAGVRNNGTIGTLTNNGRISAGSTGIWNNGSIGTLSNSGTISGGGGNGYTSFNGINNTGKITELDNNGGGQIIGNRTGLQNSGSIGSLINSGTIAATSVYDQFGISNNGSGTIGTLTNNSSGSISGSSTGIRNDGIIGTLTNSGTITSGSGGNAIANGNSISLVNNAGLISAQVGISNTGSIGTLVNSGTLLGNAGSAIGLFNGSSGSIGSLTITGSGTIAGKVGISNAGILGPVSNAGIISGSVSALSNSSTGTIGTITNSGTIAGNIVNLSTRDLNLNGGTGSTFGTLTGVSGSIGTISNTLSNVNFGSGNLLLNDNVNVGSNTVNNTAATLQINNPLTITGNYNQGAAATLLVGAADGATANGSLSDTGYGRLVVSGSATIASGSNVILQKLNSYRFAPGQRFVVVDASSTGTNYNEGSLNYAATGYDTSTVSGSTVTSDGRSDLVVTLAELTPSSPSSPPPSSPSSPPPSVPSQATAPNAVSALTGLLNYQGISPQLLNLFDASQALSGDSANTINRAGKQLAPTSQTSSIQAAAAPTFDMLNIVSAHSDSLRLAQADSGVSTGESGPAWSAWGQTFGGHASRNESDQVDGYSANFGGLLLGVDRAISDTWRLGGVFSYSNAAVNNTGDTAGDSATINSYGLIGYASYEARSWYGKLSVGALQQRYDTTRQIDFPGFSGIANGSFSGQQYVAQGEVGYPLALGVATVTPLASLTYSYLHQGAYAESGGDGAALSVGAGHDTSVTTDVGAKIERAISTSYGMLVPDLRAAWRHEYDNTRTSTTASFAADPSGETSFTTLGASPVNDMAVLSAGATLLRANNLSLTLRYEVQMGSGYLSQSGSLRLRQLF